MKSLLTSNLLPSRLQYRISKPDGSNGDADCPGLSAMKNHNSWGFTLIELMIVVAILVILAGIGLPAYRNHLEKAQIVTAVAEIKMITIQIEAYRATNFDLPADLSDVGYEGFEDPWGNPYIYVNLKAGGGPVQARVNGNNNPLNSDFDLYSMGRDGKTHNRINQTMSLDDIIRGKEGNFIGPVSKYEN